MSVILDALKKLDREKASRGSGTANIAVEILRADLPGFGKRVPRYAAIALFTAFVTAAITYVVVVKGSFFPKPAPLPVMSPPVLKQEVAPVTPSAEPAPGARDEIRPEPPKVYTPIRTGKPEAPLAEGKGHETKMKQSAVAKETALPVEKPRLPAEPAPQPVERTRVPAEAAPQASAKTLPSLNISAIVWYEEPSRRFAMINGLIVPEGAVVEGMKVEEIYPDRVRFLYQSQHLEIHIK